ncbi:MAG TPA: polysaccharide biosynthesis tyrosine autokinase [Chloroflexia bacterium]|jgi:non-specific protein-tyrosine kinase
MELMQYWRVIQRSLWIIILILLAAGAAAAYYTLEQPAEYESSATLVLNPAISSSFAPYPEYQTMAAATLADSYSALLHTRSFGEAVSKELPFSMSPGEIIGSISTELEKNTFFYNISVRTSTPEHAQQLTRATIQVFLKTIEDQARSNAERTAGLEGGLRQRLDANLKYLEQQITNYQDRIELLEAQPSSPERDSQLLELRGQLVNLNDTQSNTLIGLAQLEIGSATPNTALVLDEPLPGSRISANLARNLGLAVAVALLLGVGIAFLRDYLDYTIHSPEQLEELLSLTPMAAVGVVEGAGNYGNGRRKRNKGGDPKTARSPLETLYRPKSPISEAFRVLRTNIQFSSPDAPVRSIAVTSAGPGEGKSFTASNLAVVMAQAGKRVVLVDADLRKPTLHQLFKLPNTRGLTNLIVNEPLELEDVAQPIAELPNLSVITSGPLPPNPSELLDSHRVQELMSRLVEKTDMVVYDTPPAGVVSDALILCTRVDAALLVIGASTTRRDVIARVVQSLQKVGVTHVLPVLNRIKSRDMKGYYYYNSYYASDASDASHATGNRAGDKIVDVLHPALSTNGRSGGNGLGLYANGNSHAKETLLAGEHQSNGAEFKPQSDGNPATTEAEETLAAGHRHGDKNGNEGRPLLW